MPAKKKSTPKRNSRSPGASVKSPDDGEASRSRSPNVPSASTPSGGDATPTAKSPSPNVGTIQDGDEDIAMNIHFGMDSRAVHEEEAIERLLSIESKHDFMSNPITDGNRHDFKKLYPDLIEHGYDEAALAGMLRVLAQGCTLEHLQEVVPMLSSTTVKELSGLQVNALKAVIDSFQKVEIDKTEIKQVMGGFVRDRNVLQGFNGATNGLVKKFLKPVIEDGTINVGGLPPIENMNDFTASGLAVLLNGAGLLPENVFAVAANPIQGELDDVNLGASVEELVNSKRASPDVTLDYTNKVKRVTGYARPSLYLTTGSKVQVNYMKALTQFIQNFKERIPIPFDFRMGLAVLNEFSKFMLQFFRAVIEVFPDLFIGKGEFLDEALGVLTQVIKHPYGHASFLEHRAISTSGYSSIHILPTVVKCLNEVMKGSEDNGVVPNFGKPIGLIYLTKFLEHIDLYAQIVKFIEMVANARKLATPPRGQLAAIHSALSEGNMVQLLEAIINALVYEESNNRRAIQELMRKMRTGLLATLHAVSAEVQQLTQDGSLKPEQRQSAAPRALSATTVDAGAAQTGQLTCFKWKETGSCARGNNCRYVHGGDVPATKKSSSGDAQHQAASSTSQDIKEVARYKKHFEETKQLFQLFKGIFQLELFSAASKIGYLFRRVQVDVNGQRLVGIALKRNDQNENQPVFVPFRKELAENSKLITNVVAAETLGGNNALPLLLTAQLKDLGLPPPSDALYAAIPPSQLLVEMNVDYKRSKLKASGSSGKGHQVSASKVSGKGYSKGMKGGKGGGKARVL